MKLKPTEGQPCNNLQQSATGRTHAAFLSCPVPIATSPTPTLHE